MSKPKPLAAKVAAAAPGNPAGLLTDLRQLIEQSRQTAVAAVNASLTLMYRTLRDRVDSMLFERTALSKKPDKLIRLELDALQAQGDMTPPLLLKDPYLLDFLALDDRYLEKGLEDAILPSLRQNMNASSLVQKVWNFCYTGLPASQRAGCGAEIVATLSRQFRRRLLAPSRPTILSAPPKACA